MNTSSIYKTLFPKSYAETQERTQMIIKSITWCAQESARIEKEKTDLRISLTKLVNTATLCLDGILESADSK